MQWTSTDKDERGSASWRPTALEFSQGRKEEDTDAKIQLVPLSVSQHECFTAAQHDVSLSCHCCTLFNL